MSSVWLGGRILRSEAEVDELVARRSLHDVAGLDIAMHDALRMNCGQGGRHGDRDLDRLGHGNGTAVGERAVQRASRKVFHGKPEDASRLFERYRIKAHDVRMLHLAQGARFLDDDS